MARAPVELTPRQRQCLGLLSQGYKRNQIAEEIGKTVSNVTSHLSGARRALGADTLSQAMFEFGKMESAEDARHRPSTQGDPADPRSLAFPPLMVEIADYPALRRLGGELESCADLDAGWKLLHRYMQGHGATHLSFAVEGKLDIYSGRCLPLFISTLPADASAMLCGLDRRNHARAWGGLRRQGVHVVNISSELLPRLRGKGTEPVKAYCERFCALRLEHHVVFEVFEAAGHFAVDVALAFEPHLNGAFAEKIERISADVKLAARLFFWILRERGHFRPSFNLTPDERNALRLLAAGCQNGEAAKELARGERTVNDLLKSVRVKLHSRTNIQAFYVALVFRLLQ